MKSSGNYNAGRRREWQVRDDLADNGYQVIRAAGSKGPVDLVAMKPGEVLVVQVKLNSAGLSPASRLALLQIASDHAVPLVAYKPLARKPIQYRRLTGLGPKDWQPWTPDEAAL